MSSNLKVNSLVPATGTEIGIGTTGGSIDFRCAATFGGNVTIGGTLTYDEVINIDSIGVITARSNIDCNGSLDVDGHTDLDNVSISGVSTTTRLDINSTTPIINFLESDGNPDYRLYAESGAFVIRDQTSVANRLVINSTGVSVPNDLDVDGHTNLDNVSIAGVSTFSNNATFSTNVLVSGKIRIENTSYAAQAAGNELIVGTTAGDNGITIASGSSGTGNIYFGDADSNSIGYMRYDHNSNFLKINVNGSERLRITSSGIVQISQSAPQLQLKDSDGTNQLVQFMQSGGATYLDLRDNTSDGQLIIRGKGGDTATEKLRIASDGVLTAQKSASFGNTSDSFTAVQITSSTSGISELRFGDTTANAGYVKYEHSGNNLIFATNATERARINSNGDVRVGGGAPATFGSGTTVHETYNASTYTANLVTSGTHQLQMIASQTHGATSIGTRSNHQLNLCVNDSTKASITTSGNLSIADGNLVIGTSGHGIDFSATANATHTSPTSGQNPSTDSEVLTDYEHGTWTPRLRAYDHTGGAGWGTMKYTDGTDVTGTGRYVKVGRYVWAGFKFESGSKIFDSNWTYWSIDNVPYGANHYDKASGSTYVNQTNFFTDSNSHIGGFVHGHDAYMVVNKPNGHSNATINTSNDNRYCYGHISIYSSRY